MLSPRSLSFPLPNFTFGNNYPGNGIVALCIYRILTITRAFRVDIKTGQKLRDCGKDAVCSEKKKKKRKQKQHRVRFDVRLIAPRCKTNHSTLRAESHSDNVFS